MRGHQSIANQSINQWAIQQRHTEGAHCSTLWQSVSKSSHTFLCREENCSAGSAGCRCMHQISTHTVCACLCHPEPLTLFQQPTSRKPPTRPPYPQKDLASLLCPINGRSSQIGIISQPSTVNLSLHSVVPVIISCRTTPPPLNPTKPTASNKGSCHTTISDNVSHNVIL